MFSNRLQKLQRHIGRQAKKSSISCYRLYDHDLPEFPFIIERYEENIYVSEYKRRHGMSEEEHEDWWQACAGVMQKVLEVKPENIFWKQRQRKAGRTGQYQKLDLQAHERIVQEDGLKFIVNLSDYLDTGLFLDHRLTRSLVKNEAKDKKVLNLFCYTASFSVYAMAGGAAAVTSVDLSKTYLQWAERNVALNFENTSLHRTIHADALQFIKEEQKDSYDMIVLDPPTFSNSQRMQGVLDVQRDHVDLINHCLRLLKANGILYFSTNYTKFVLNEAAIEATEIKDITKATTPFDFADKLKRPCFKIIK